MPKETSLAFCVPCYFLQPGTGRSRNPVLGNGISIDNEELNALGGQKIQHLGEVVIDRKVFH